MRCRNIVEASRQAQANANSSGKPWVFFKDTSGYAHAEPATEGMLANPTSWSGVTFTVVQPQESQDAAT